MIVHSAISRLGPLIGEREFLELIDTPHLCASREILVAGFEETVSIRLRHAGCTGQLAYSVGPSTPPLDAAFYTEFFNNEFFVEDALRTTLPKLKMDARFYAFTGGDMQRTLGVASRIESALAPEWRVRRIDHTQSVTPCAERLALKTVLAQRRDAPESIAAAAVLEQLEERRFVYLSIEAQRMW